MVTQNKNPFKLPQIKKGNTAFKDSPRNLTSPGRKCYWEKPVGKQKVGSETPSLSRAFWACISDSLPHFLLCNLIFHVGSLFTAELFISYWVVFVRLLIVAPIL